MVTERLAWFGSALAFVVAMSATPGPNNAMVTASGAVWGLRRTMPHVVGISIGFPLMVLTVALGAGELLRANPWAQEGLRWLGAAYMLWLAVKIARARPEAVGEQDPRSGRPLSLWQAALFQWVNPKAWVAAIGAVVTYTTGGSALLGEASALAAMFLLVSVPVLLFWTLVGVGAARLLRTPRAMRRFSLAMAGLLVLSLVPLLLED